MLRISGRGTRDLIARLCGRVPAPRRASLRRLRNAAGAELDQAILLWLPGPGSYTGEDSAELHLHGGAAVLDGVASALVELGARPAEAGEFTRRAFLNGRLDLLEAEAIADLVAAESSAQREQALRQLRGELGSLYGGWSERLRHLMAHQEALIDFPDEDLPPEVDASLEAGIATLAAEIGAHLADDRRGERVREGLTVAVIGPPNVGKSSLINALTGRDVAIVSDRPGTTRDALEARVTLAGVPATLIDTAGLREAADPVEAEGIRRARARADSADFILAVETCAEPRVPASGRVLRVVNKIDLGGTVPDEAIGVSALTGAGMAALRERLDRVAADLTASTGPPPLTRQRHRVALTEAEARLRAALHAPLPELRAEDLRLALRAFGRVTGAFSVEDILDTLFGSFCIGK